MKKYEKSVTVYEIGNGYRVEADVEDGVTCYYLAHERYGIKSLMFGVPTDEIHDDAFLLEDVGEYIAAYEDEFLDPEDFDDEG